MLEGFALGSYLLLADYTGRLFGEGKAIISREVAEIFERLGSSAEIWQATAGEAEQGPARGAVFRGQSSALQGGRRAVGPAPGAQFGRVPGELMAAFSSGRERIWPSLGTLPPGDSVGRPVTRDWPQLPGLLSEIDRPAGIV